MLRALTSFFRRHKAPVEPRRRRLGLEGLEARDCPAATFLWTGATDNDWFTTTNWDVIGSPAAGFPTGADDVYFDGNESNTNCNYVVNQSGDHIVANSITFNNSFTGRLYLENGSATGHLKVVDDVVMNGATTSTLRLADANTLIIDDNLHWTSGNIESAGTLPSTVEASRIELDGTSTRTSAAHINTGHGSGGNSYISMVSGGTQGLLKLDQGAVLKNGADLYHTGGTIDTTNHASRGDSLVWNASGATWAHQTSNNVTVSLGFYNEGTLSIEAGSFTIDDVSANAQATYGLKQEGSGSTLSITGGSTLYVTNGSGAGKVLLAGGQLLSGSSGGVNPKILANNGTTKGEVKFDGAIIRLGGTGAGTLEFGLSDIILAGTTDYQVTAPTASGGDELWTDGKIFILGSSTKLTINLTGGPPLAQTAYRVMRCKQNDGNDFGTISKNNIPLQQVTGYEYQGEDDTFHYMVYYNPMGGGGEG